MRLAGSSLSGLWSTWCTYTLWDWSKRRSVRAALLLYPLLTLFCIVATANHYVLDAVGGLAVFAVGCALGHVLDRSALVDRVRLRNAASSEPASLTTTPDATNAQQLTPAEKAKNKMNPQFTR